MRINSEFENKFLDFDVIYMPHRLVIKGLAWVARCFDLECMSRTESAENTEFA